MSHFPPNPGVMPGGGWQFTAGSTFGDPPPPRQWVNGVYGARTVDSYQLTRSGTAFTATVATTASWRAAGAAVARCVALLNPYCAAATAAYAAYERYRVRPDGQGGLLFDPGIAGQEGYTTRYCFPGNVNCSGIADANTFATAQEACVRPANTVAGHAAIFSATPQPPQAPYGTCSVWQTGQGGYYQEFVIGAKGVQGTTCPASTDPFNPAYSVPAGSPVGFDGRCPSARYNWQPITPDNASHHFDGQTGADTTVNDAIQDAVESGQSIPATNQTGGPASVTGSPTQTTTTGPSGTSTTTSTPSYTFNYGPTTITYGPTTTTTTTINNNGGTTTTTTTETTTPAAPEDGQTDCDKYPNTLGCTPIGDMPDDAVPTAQRTLTFEAESLGLPSGCPAPHIIDGVGTISYAQACDTATGMRPFIIATGIAAAVLLVLAALREL